MKSEREECEPQQKLNICVIIFTSCIFFVTFLVSFLFLSDNFEFACLVGRIEYYKCVNQIPKHTDHCKVKSNNSLLMGELMPGCDVVSDGFAVKIPETNIKINSMGFRDYEYALEKPNNTFRIIALGDSHTFGWGVELNESYPKMLERLLNEKDEKIKYEVLNFGVPGYGTFEEVELFKKLGMKFDPDFVILQYGADDIYSTAGKRELNLERNFEDLWKSTMHSLEDLGEVCNKSNTNILIFTLYGEEEWSTYNFKEQAKGLKNLEKKYNWKSLYTLMPKYFHEHKWWDLLLHPRDPHPSRLAYKKIAEDIAKRILENNVF